MTIAELEKRLEVVERELAELKRLKARNPANEGWLKIYGRHAGDEEYEAIVRAGKEWRRQENERVE